MTTTTTTTTTMTTKTTPTTPPTIFLLLLTTLLLSFSPAFPLPPATIICGVDDDYNRYMGVKFDGRLGAGEVGESLTAKVVTPATVIRLGLERAQMNDAVTFRNHNNGWWTIELQRTGQSVKLPLFYMAVWGFRPDNDMEDGVIPTEVPGTVTDPALFKKLGIAGMKRGDRVVLETDGKMATHLLLASGERKLIP
jgi:hypothetical protein